MKRFVVLRPGAGETIGPLTVLEPFTVHIRVYSVLSFNSFPSISSSLLSQISSSSSSSHISSSLPAFVLNSKTSPPTSSSNFRELNSNSAVELAEADILKLSIPAVAINKSKSNNILTALLPDLEANLNLCVELWTNTPIEQENCLQEEKLSSTSSNSTSWHAIKTVRYSSTLQTILNGAQVDVNESFEAFSEATRDLKLVVIGEFRAVVIPSSPGRFEFTARCKDYSNNVISWPSGFGANASVTVLFDDNHTQLLQENGRPSYVQSNESMVSSLRQILLKGFNEMINTIETRALFFLRTSVRLSGGQIKQPPFLRLVCYYVALLLCEIIAIRGENIEVAASLADILLSSCLFTPSQTSGQQLWASSRSLLTKLLKRYLGDQASQRTVQSLWMIPIQENITYFPSNQFQDMQYDSVTIEIGRQNQRRSIQSLIEMGLGIETSRQRKMGSFVESDAVILELILSIIKSSSFSPVRSVHNGFGSLFSTPLINLLVYCSQVANVPALAIRSVGKNGDNVNTCGLSASTHGTKAWINSILLILFYLPLPLPSTVSMYECSHADTRRNASPFILSNYDQLLNVPPPPPPPSPSLMSGNSGKVFCDSIKEAAVLMGVCSMCELMQNVINSPGMTLSLQQSISESVGAALLHCVTATSAKVSQSVLSETEYVQSTQKNPNNTVKSSSRASSISNTLTTPPPTPPRNIKRNDESKREKMDVIRKGPPDHYSAQLTQDNEKHIIHTGRMRGSLSPVLKNNAITIGLSTDDNSRCDSPFPRDNDYGRRDSAFLRDSPVNVEQNITSTATVETQNSMFDKSTRHNSSRGFHSHNNHCPIPSSPPDLHMSALSDNQISQHSSVSSMMLQGSNYSFPTSSLIAPSHSTDSTSSTTSPKNDSFPMKSRSNALETSRESEKSGHLLSSTKPCSVFTYDLEAYGDADFSPPSGIGPQCNDNYMAMYVSGDALLQQRSHQKNQSLSSSLSLLSSSFVSMPSIRELLLFSLNALKGAPHPIRLSNSLSPLARLVTTIIHCIVRLSPSTFPEFELLLRCAVQMSAVDEGVSRYTTSRVLISWPRSDSEKERAMLQLVAALAPLWTHNENISSVLPSYLVPGLKQIMRRTCSRACLSLKSKHAAVANEAILFILPRSLNAPGRTSSASFGLRLLQLPASLVAVARVLERNAGAVSQTSEVRQKSRGHQDVGKERRKLIATDINEPLVIDEEPVSSPPELKRLNPVNSQQVDVIEAKVKNLSDSTAIDEDNCDSASCFSKTYNSEGFFSDFLSVTLSESTDFDDNFSDKVSVVSSGCDSEDGVLISHKLPSRHKTPTSTSSSPRSYLGSKDNGEHSLFNDDEQDYDNWDTEDLQEENNPNFCIPSTNNNDIDDVSSRRRLLKSMRRGRVIDVTDTPSTLRSHSAGSNEVRNLSLVRDAPTVINCTRSEKRSAQRKACRLVISGLVVIDAHKRAVAARLKDATVTNLLDIQRQGANSLSPAIPAPPVYHGSGHWSATIRCNSIAALQLLETTMVDKLAIVERSKDPDLLSSLESFVRSRRRRTIKKSL
jgi:hypothetical protein